METESSQSLSLCSSSSSLPPPQNPVEHSFIFVTLISNYGLRYEGLLYHLNIHDSTLGLQNVICHGTEGRNNNGFQIFPSPDVYSYIVFTTTQIKDILVKPPTSFAHSCFSRGALSSKLAHATKPLLPIIFSSYNPHGDKKRQKVPLISNGKLNEPESTTDSDSSLVINGPVNGGLHIASNPIAQPQFPGSDFYGTWSNDHVHQTMPCGALNQAPIDAASSLNLPDDPFAFELSDHVSQTMPCGALHQAPINAASSLNLPDDLFASELEFAPKSFFTTFPPVPISLKQADGGFEFQALTKNFKKYELWGPLPGNNNQRDQTARLVKHTEEFSNNLQRGHQLQPPLSNFRGGYIYNTPL